MSTDTNITFHIRSNEQLLFLLKLVDVNQLDAKRRNVNERQKLWKAIAEKLNRLSANGAEKDGDGWKRCFKSWCLGVGPDYKTKMQELIKLVPSDGNYLIKVIDDEEEVKLKPVTNTITEQKGPPIEKQKQLLHELILKHKMLLVSTANDEPLKTRLWENISQQLNAIPDGITQTPLQWKQSVNLDKYRTKRGRKPKSSISEDRGINLSYTSLDETTQASTSSQGQIKTNIHQNNNSNESHQKGNSIESSETINKTDSTSSQGQIKPNIHQNNNSNESHQKSNSIESSETINKIDSTSSQGQIKPNIYENNNSNESHQKSNSIESSETINQIDRQLEESDDDDVDDMTSSESISCEEDNDTLTSEPERKRPRPSPLVKNFKFSNRMICAVEQLRDDVQCVNNTLKKTTRSLDNIRDVLERQCEQQEDFNALLKRSTQLLKVLVEFKIGKRTSITKRNYQITNET